jgi:3-phosphoshikimate 1-carboxyvinyltransferase
LALGPATGGSVTVTGLPSPDDRSGQPDASIVEVLRAFGAVVTWRDGAATATGRLVTPVALDLGGAPDLAPLVGALGCLVVGTTTVSGAAHLRLKESDRIAAVVDAARALGCAAEERSDGFVVHGAATRGGAVCVRGDHRLAMAFAVVGSALGDVRIDDPACVGKSFPGFWHDVGHLLAVEVSSP